MEQWRHVLGTPPRRDISRGTEVRAIDLTSDGKDEIVLSTERNIKALSSTGELLWDENHEVGFTWIEDVLPSDHSPTIIVGKNHAYLG